jgi:hypothetical protein
MLWKILAASAFAGVVALALTSLPTSSQQTGPAAVNGCIYISGGVTLTNLQSTVFLCDINGRLKVTTTP